MSVRLSTEPTGSGYLDAFIEFDKPILGIAATPATLNPSDAVVGQPMPTGTRSGLSDSDTLAISEDGRTLRLRLKEGQRDALASFRVFVQDREIALPSLSEGAFATPRVNNEQKPDLTGKNLPDASLAPDSGD